MNKNTPTQSNRGPVGRLKNVITAEDFVVTHPRENHQTSSHRAKKMLKGLLALRPFRRQSLVAKIGIGTAFLLILIVPHAAFAVSWGAVWAGLAMVAVGVVLVVAAPVVAAAATAALVAAGVSGVVVGTTAVVAAGYTLAVVGLAVEAAGGLEKPDFLFATGQVPAAASPLPAAPPAAAVQTPLAQLPLLGNSADSFVADGNQTITASNALASDMASNPINEASDLAALNASLTADATGFNQVFDDIGANIPELEFTQAQIDAAQAAIGTSGFPSDISTAFSEIGLSASEMAAFSSYVSSNPLALDVPGITPSDLLRETGALTSTPEPSTGLLLASRVCLASLFSAWVAAGWTDENTHGRSLHIPRMY